MRLLKTIAPLIMNRSFFTKVFISICLVSLIGIFSMSIIYQYYFRKTLTEIEMERVQRSVDQTALNLDNQLKRIVNDMYYFFAYSNTGEEMLQAEVSDTRVTDDMAQAAKSLEAFRLRYSGDLESVFFYREDPADGSGKRKATFFYDDSLSRNMEIDYKQEQWYDYFRQKLNKLWTDPTKAHLFYQDRSQRSMWLTMGKYDYAGRDGIFVVRLNEKMFSDAFRLLINPDWQIELLDGSGHIVYSSLSPVTDIHDGNWLQMKSELGFSEFQVNVHINKQAIIDKVSKIEDIHAVIIGLVLIITLFISIILTMTLVRPVKTLIKLMRKVETGDFDVRFPIKYKDEVGKLGNGFNQMVSRVSELIQQVYVIRMEKMESQLRQKEATVLAMQNQINPHFLYNTLEAINCHAIVSDVPSISHMSKALADFFRYSVDKQHIEVGLFAEIKHVKTYLEIQQERYPEIEVDIDIPEELMTYPIVKLTLQPIIENAYHHAFVGERSYFLKITAESVDERMYAIDFEDNGEGMTEEQLEQMNAMFTEGGKEGFPRNRKGKRHGIGLLNVHTRIRLHCGEPYGVHVEESDYGGVKVRVLLPKGTLRDEEDDHELSGSPAHSDNPVREQSAELARDPDNDPGEKQAKGESAANGKRTDMDEGGKPHESTGRG